MAAGPPDPAAVRLFSPRLSLTDSGVAKVGMDVLDVP
jgi:hypothetical protein